MSDDHETSDDDENRVFVTSSNIGGNSGHTQCPKYVIEYVNNASVGSPKQRIIIRYGVRVKTSTPTNAPPCCKRKISFGVCTTYSIYIYIYRRFKK